MSQTFKIKLAIIYLIVLLCYIVLYFDITNIFNHFTLFFALTSFIGILCVLYNMITGCI